MHGILGGLPMPWWRFPFHLEAGCTTSSIQCSITLSLCSQASSEQQGWVSDPPAFDGDLTINQLTSLYSMLIDVFFVVSVVSKLNKFFYGNNFKAPNFNIYLRENCLIYGKSEDNIVFRISFRSRIYIKFERVLRK